MVFKSVAFYLAIAGLIAAISLTFYINKKPIATESAFEPARNPFESTIAASGIIEAVNENVAIGVPEPGLVTQLFVEVGDSVKENEPLFALDTRDLKAQLDVQKAQVDVSEASLLRLQDKVDRLQKIHDPRAISDEERKQRENDVKVAQAELNAAKSTAGQTEALINRLTIRAPKDGVILQNNVRKGEYIPLTPVDPAMILGDMKELQVRVDVDEQNASRVQFTDKAVAYPKNNSTLAIPLRFQRVEPFVIPKKSLTGNSDERVDTRVLQIIYTFDQPKNFNVYVGQQVDVFIEAKALDKTLFIPQKGDK